MDIIHQIVVFADAHGFSTILSLLIANLALGVAIAIRDKQFRLRNVADICEKAAPLLITYAVVDLVLRQSGLTTAVFGVIVAQATGDVMKNLVALVPQLEGKLPESLVGKH